MAKNPVFPRENSQPTPRLKENAFAVNRDLPGQIALFPDVTAAQQDTFRNNF
jgi:hypothetical protein